MRQLPLPLDRRDAAVASSSAPIVVSKTVAMPKTKLFRRQLERRLGHPIHLVFTDNKTTVVSQSFKSSLHSVRLHQMFLEGDDALVADIAEFVASACPASGERIDRFILRHEHLLRKQKRAVQPADAEGKYFDLLTIYRQLNAQYFRGAVEADIMWGRRPQTRKRKRRHSITLGSYDPRAACITIHRALDGAFIPDYCIARVVHHEMLHAVFPPEHTSTGRRLVHGPQFRKAEALFAEADKADAWIDDNIDRLLRR